MQSSDGEYSYPVVVDLPASNSTLFTGSTANVVIDTGSVSNVLAVPTSAVETTGTRSYVLEADKGELTRKVVKVGMVGDTYTQVLSGLSDGQSVVLADYAEAVPSSNTDLTNALGGGRRLRWLRRRWRRFGGGAGTFRQRISGAGGRRRFHRRRLTTLAGADAPRTAPAVRWPGGSDPARSGESGGARRRGQPRLLLPARPALR